MEEASDFIRTLNHFLDLQFELENRDSILNFKLRDQVQKMDSLQDEINKAQQIVLNFKHPRVAHAVLGIRDEALAHLIRLNKKKIEKIKTRKINAICEEKNRILIRKREVEAGLEQLMDTELGKEFSSSWPN